MSIAYSYRRFSSPGQLEGDSLRRQTEMAQKYCEANNLTLDSSLNLTDLGVSAFKSKNVEKGNLGQFLAAIDKGLVQPGSLLLVESLDRLSRDNVLEALELFLSIIRRGVSIVTLADNRLYSQDSINANFTELIISIAVMARAHDESKMKSVRRKASWVGAKIKAKNGGEKITAICPFWLRLKDDRKSFEVIDEWAEIVREIYSLSKSGYGALRIARALNERGIKPPKSKTGWGTSTVADTLTNEAVIGNTTIQNELIEGYYPAIMDTATFYEVRNRFKNRKGGRTHKAWNLFSHIIKCGHCGGGMVMESSNKEDGSGYRKKLSCMTARKGHGCSIKMWNYEEVEDWFFAYVKEIDASSLIEDEGPSIVGELEGRLGEVIEKIGRLMDALESGQSTTIATRLTMLEKDKERLEAMIREERGKVPNRDGFIHNFTSLKKALVDNVEMRMRARELIKSVVEEIRLFPRGREAKPGTGAEILGMKEGWEGRYVEVRFKTGAVRLLMDGQTVVWRMPT